MDNTMDNDSDNEQCNGQYKDCTEIKDIDILRYR